MHWGLTSHVYYPQLDLEYVLVIHVLKNRSKDVNPVYKELRECLNKLIHALAVGCGIPEGRLFAFLLNNSDHSSSRWYARLEDPGPWQVV